MKLTLYEREALEIKFEYIDGESTIIPRLHYRWAQTL